jgi:hypothetical protein
MRKLDPSGETPRKEGMKPGTATGFDAVFPPEIATCAVDIGDMKLK